ncbi:DNA polymerase I [Portibacter lacus]|uniref:DNA polymerase I n=1 Tax=Portibacter lacus TaxID=1099794 RepID=A0AA37WFJ7_9BACT|nr:DNA polymerase I [Portibacter lacus]GLR17729.1 DNA polymerase I [Portibacter lacus]
MSEKKLFLLDGHALVYRAHYAFINRPLINSKGINTSAITGFVRTLWDLLKTQKPTHIAVAFDPSGPTFRNEQYAEYKANREEQPKDITTAFPYIKSIVEGFNIPIITVDGFEADDTIGTIAKQAEKEGYTVYMVTPDKDYAQLVSENIFMYKPSRQGNGVEIIGVPEVLEKWDIENVLQVIDVLGLQGDSVDNIPGIPGIGAKTASKLLKQFGSVENLIENVDQLKGKQKENVINFAEQGLMSKSLATIKLDVPIQFNAKSYTHDPINKEVLAELFKELEFRTLADAILGSNTKAPVQQSLFGNSEAPKPEDKVAANYQVADKNITDVKHNYILVNDETSRKDLVKLLSSQEEISFDTETTGLDVHQAELVGLAFAINPNEAYYVPVPEDREKTMEIVNLFKPILENPDIKKIGQNIKYDILMMKWYGVELKGKYFDTMIAHYLSEPDKRHKLDYLSEAYLNYKMVPIEALIGKKGKNQLNMRDIDLEKVSEYAGEDADVTLQLRDPLKDLLKENELLDLYEELEYPLIDVLAGMEFEGVRINPEFLANYSTVLGDLIVNKEKEIYEKAGVKFNIASPSQVGAVLFEKLEIPYRWRKTSSGKYSTDVDKLTELAVEHEIVSDILEFRKYSKLKSTYVDALPQLINPKTGRVHSSFNQARAATGRLSSENPNLQNIPIKDAAGREIRKAFEPRDKDHLLFAADYSQIELRLIAEISKDEGMMEAFINGLDFHTATAAKIFEVPLEEVTSDQRRTAKTVNFSITYGAGATNLSRQLGIKRTEASEIITQYFKQFPGLQNYMVETVEDAKKTGFVSTLMGRRRYLRDINSNSGLARSNAERMAVNTPIQGTAADMIKVAMIQIHHALKDAGLRSKMILQVHDELVFDVYKPEFDQVKEIVEEKMKNALPGLKVPILVGMGSGENWLEAH